MDARDVTMVLDALDPVVFSPSGLGVQGDPAGEHFDYPPEAFTHGSIAGRAAPCLSETQQRAFHSGYEHRAKDKHDLAVLDLLSAHQEPR